jgi:hypothetical protein
MPIDQKASFPFAESDFSNSAVVRGWGLPDTDPPIIICTDPDSNPDKVLILKISKEQKKKNSIF